MERRSHEKFRVHSTLFYLSALIVGGKEGGGGISLHVMQDAVGKKKGLILNLFLFFFLFLRNERSDGVKSSWPRTKPSTIP